jgi:hypothetical protein
MAVEQQRGADDHQADAHEARAERDQEPVADVGDDIALAPPRRAGIAGRPMSQRREHEAEGDGDRDQLEHGLAGDFEDAQEFGEHGSDLSDARTNASGMGPHG